MDLRRFQAGCARLGLRLSEAQLSEFARFGDALYAANLSMNLTRVPAEKCELLHFLDSLLFQDLVPKHAHVLDVGTGPGFPAWPLARARPDLGVTALDSSGKMMGFLRSQLLPNLECVECRAEAFSSREQYDFVTGRAVAPLPIQLELSAAPCRIGGLVVPMRTPGDLVEIERLDVALLGLSLREVVRRVLPDVAALRVFPIYEKTAATPASFPRSWAAMKRKQLGS